MRWSWRLFMLVKILSIGLTEFIDDSRPVKFIGIDFIGSGTWTQ
jgi:hypothetical protein